MRCPTCGASDVRIDSWGWECTWCGDSGRFVRRIVTPRTDEPKDEERSRFDEILTLVDQSTAVLLRAFPDAVKDWNMDEMLSMGAEEIIKKAYEENEQTGAAMWKTLVTAERSRLREPKEAEWLLGDCCPYKEAWEPPFALLDALKDEPFAALVFGSAYVGAEQLNLLEAARDSGRRAQAARFLTILEKNPLPHKKWSIPWEVFKRTLV